MTKAKNTATRAAKPSIGSLRKRMMAFFPLFRKRYTYISCEVSILGDIVAQEDVVVDGEVTGNIRSTKNVTLGPTAKLLGSIESETALICGSIKGRIQTNDSLVVRVPAKVIGDLVSTSVQVESGVELQGRIFSSPNQTQGLCVEVGGGNTINIANPAIKEETVANRIS